MIFGNRFVWSFSETWVNAFHSLSIGYGTYQSPVWGRCFHLFVPQMLEVSWINQANDRNIATDLKLVKRKLSCSFLWNHVFGLLALLCLVRCPTLRPVFCRSAAKNGPMMCTWWCTACVNGGLLKPCQSVIQITCKKNVWKDGRVTT